MASYNFTECLSPLDFELLSKDLLEAELGFHLENFSEGRDKGIDLRYAPVHGAERTAFNTALLGTSQKPPALIVQCKRYSSFANLKSELKNKELAKITKLNPARYILTTSVSLSPQQVDELKEVLSPFIQSTGDIYGNERLNSMLTKHREIERRHIKLWVTSAGVLDAIINAGTHVVSSEEVERTIAAAKLYVRNASFDEALAILKQHRVCIISGQPGIGKTTLAQMLLLYFYDRKYDVVKIESDISEARAVSYHKNPRYYYYDDFLGQTAQADKLNKNEDQKLLDFMASIRASKDSVFVLTTREYILTQEKLAREKFDHRTCIIDLAKYSRRIKAQILYNHLHFSDLPREHLKELIDKRGYVEIVDHKNYNPRLIEYLTNLAWIGKTPSAQYLDLFLGNLDNPVEIWENAFRSQLSDKDRHLLFVITTMPLESLLSDVEQAFAAFHNSQCVKFNIAHSSADFRCALKVLDGTFVATRKVQDSMLVRFQNPSIRDFMQNLLLTGELLPEVINTLVFFEQAKWFEATLRDKNPQISLKALKPHASKIADMMQSLIGVPSCSISVYEDQKWQHLSRDEIDLAKRLASTAKALSKRNVRDDDEWMAEKISKLITLLDENEISLSSCIGPIKVLNYLGYLGSDEGNELISLLKSRAMDAPADMDDFETLANVVKALPRLFAESELEAVREAYSTFVEHYGTSCDIRNPEKLREEASRVEDVGDLLEVDTNSAQEALREAADEIETEQDERPDDDDDWRGGQNSEVCSNSELDSMFGTLAS